MRLYHHSYDCLKRFPNTRKTEVRKNIFTDNDKMARAVEQVFPKTCNHLCLLHILEYAANYMQVIIPILFLGRHLIDDFLNVKPKHGSSS